MSVLYKLVVLSVLFLNYIESARILAFFPVPSISHQVVFRPLTEELARRGHEVTVITPDPAFPRGEAPPNLREIDVHDISYKVWTEKFMSTPKDNSRSLINQVRMFLDLGYSFISAQLIHEDVQNLINNKNETFDLLLLEACMRSALALSFVYKVPVIQVSSFGASYGNFEAVGAPIHPFLYSSINRKKNINLTMWEKINLLYDEYQIARVNNEYEKIEDVLLKKLFGAEIPSVTELWNNVHMLFLNVHPVFEGIRPVPPSVVYIGGLHVKPPEELPAVSFLFFESLFVLTHS